MQKLKLVLRKRMIPKVRNSFMTEVPHRNQSIEYDRDLPHERVKVADIITCFQIRHEKLNEKLNA